MTGIYIQLGAMALFGILVCLWDYLGERHERATRQSKRSGCHR